MVGCLVRGRATERQDHHLPLVQRIAEGSEELRLSLCRMIGRMLVTLMDRGTVGVLRPYLDDTILLLVSQCRDPYSTVTVEALSIITKLVLHPHLEQVRRRVLCGPISYKYLHFCNYSTRRYNNAVHHVCRHTQGMKFYAVGLSRAILPHLRHRSVQLLASCFGPHSRNELPSSARV